MRRLAPVLLVLLLAGCGSSSKPAAKSSVPLSPAVTNASPTASVSPTASPPLTAATVVSALKAHGLPVRLETDYTAVTDPNHLLGRPNGYASKVAFADARVKRMPGDTDSVAGGGSVEVFPTAQAAKARYDYIRGIAAALPIVGNEYDTVVGTVVLRVTGILTPDQATPYATALHDIAG